MQLPLRSILWSADYKRRIAKWGTILGAFDIKYMPRTSIKGQVLADLVAEFAEPLLEEEVRTQDVRKTSWCDFPTRAHMLESVCRWHNKSKMLWSGASPDLP